MAQGTGIEWTRGDDGTAGATWNPVAGCTIVSPGCKNCYAMRMAARLESMGQAKYAGTTKKVNGHAVWTGKINLDPDALLAPLSWKKPRRVFVNSMSDLFHKEVPFDYVDKVFAVMALAPRHTFQVLTKRPERMAEYLNRHEAWAPVAYAGGSLTGTAAPATMHKLLKAWNERSDGWWPLPNVWLGTSCEDQARADERIPHLLKCPAAVRFISAEPLLGPIEFSDVTGRADAVSQLGKKALNGIDWVIVGGESGPGARPMHPQWARSIRDQCQAAGAAYFLKQWGEWLPFEEDAQPPFWRSAADGFLIDGHAFPENLSDGDPVGGWWCPELLDGVVYHKVGKKVAGRKLDGRVWSEFPKEAVTAYALPPRGQRKRKGERHGAQLRVF